MLSWWVACMSKWLRRKWLGTGWTKAGGTVHSDKLILRQEEERMVF